MPKVKSNPRKTPNLNTIIEFKIRDDKEKKESSNDKSSLKLFSCEFCDEETVKTITELKSHIRKHVASKEKQTQTCNICFSSFENATMLFHHSKRCHNMSNKFSCENCNFSTSRKQELVEHFVEYHTKPVKQLNFFSCNKCPLKIRDKDAFEEHLLYHLRLVEKNKEREKQERKEMAAKREEMEKQEMTEKDKDYFDDFIDKDAYEDRLKITEKEKQQEDEMAPDEWDNVDEFIDEDYWQDEDSLVEYLDENFQW